MHDPLTVAFEIKYPWYRYKPWPKKFRHSRDRKWVFEHELTEAQRKNRDQTWDEGYRDSFITIWHKDPERGGSDDSCGYSYPRLTNWQRERLWNGAWGEGQNPHFLAHKGREWEGTYTEAVSLYAGLISMVAHLLNINLTMDQIQRRALDRIHHPDCCPPANNFCFEPGYHTNNPKDSERDRQEHFYGILCGVARSLLSDLRPWWKHPKWHFWHWRFQVHPWQTFKRWAFDRCEKCGGGFKWGESAVSMGWGSKRIMHDRCSSTRVASKEAA